MGWLDGETGWPLIPREVLPAPVPAAKRRPLPRVDTPEAGRQLPFFGAETTEPSVNDLAGLLAGPGRLGRMGGTARVSVEVDAAWRVHVLVAELVTRGLVANWRPLRDEPEPEKPEPEKPEPDEHEPAEPEPDEPDLDEPELDEPEPDEPELDEPEPAEPEGEEFEPERPEPEERPEAASAEAEEASAEAEEASAEAEGKSEDEPEEGPEEDKAEAEGAEATTPAPRPRFEVLTAYSSRLNALARAWPDVSEQLFLSGPRLRLWVAAAGEPIPGGYALGLDPGKDVAAVDAALVRAGLAGRLSDDGSRMRIMGRKRVRRLAELVGERPEAAPEEMWPGGAGA